MQHYIYIKVTLKNHEIWIVKIPDGSICVYVTTKINSRSAVTQTWIVLIVEALGWQSTPPCSSFSKVSASTCSISMVNTPHLINQQEVKCEDITHNITKRRKMILTSTTINSEQLNIT